MSTNPPHTPSSSPPPAAPEFGAPTIQDARQRRLVLVAVCVALMAVIASVTGLNVAQPELAIEFDASQSQVLWFINLYTISLAALLLPLGALGDRWGRKPLLLTGLAVFGVANVTAGLAGKQRGGAPPPAPTGVRAWLASLALMWLALIPMTILGVVVGLARSVDCAVTPRPCHGWWYCAGSVRTPRRQIDEGSTSSRRGRAVFMPKA